MSDSSVATSGSEVLVCYCDSDAAYCDAFAEGLDRLRREQVISSWQRQRVASDDAGELPTSTSSQVMLLLLSPDFLATGFMQRKEFLSRISGSGNGNGASKPTVITALVRPVQTAQTHKTLNESVAPA